VKFRSTAKLTATVKNATEDLLPSVSVRFYVTCVNPTSGGSTTGTNGKATFSYVGDKDGKDTVTAYADADGNRTQDSREPFTTTSITWTTTAPSPSPSPSPSVSPSPSPSASPSPSPSPSGHFTPADPAPANPNCTYFPEIQHNLCGNFRDY
jgi:hypothetical protein